MTKNQYFKELKKQLKLYAVKESENTFVVRKSDGREIEYKLVKNIDNNATQHCKSRLVYTHAYSAPY